MRKQIVVTRFILFLFVLAGVLSALPAIRLLSPNAYAETTDVRFDTTDVLEDLRSSEGFNLLQYPFDETKTARIINFVEYGYSYRANQRKNYGLYLYVYNPQGLDWETSSAENRVQLAVSWNSNGMPNDYDKFDLKFCSKTTEPNYLGLFYKFKIVDREGADGKLIRDRVNSLERRYDVSGFELLERGKANAKEYTVGGTYKFTGYAAGYGPDVTAADSLFVTVTDLETVKLEIHHATYLSKASDTLYNQLHSVYFSVPGSTIAKFGEDLQEIKAVWYEYKTEMIAVLLPEWEQKFRSSVGLAPEAVTISEYMVWDSTASHDVSGRWTFNYGDDRSSLYWLLANAKATQEKTYIPAEELLAYMKNYHASYEKGKINGKYSADLFADGNDGQEHRKTVTIQAGENYSLLGKEQNSFEKFMNWITGRPTTYPSLQVEKAIEPLKSVNFSQTDSALAAALFVNEQEIAAMREFCETEVSAGNYPYLFRYAVRDYETAEIRTKFQNLGIGWSSEHIGFGARETVFLDFDIIYLKFFKDGQYYVIPAVSDPIDGIGGLISPDKDNPSCRNIVTLVLTVLLILVLARVIFALCKAIGRAIRQRKADKPFREMEKEFRDIEKYIRKNK